MMNYRELFIKNRLKILLLLAIIFLAVFFRFWGLNSLDIQHDLALNSVRALGWFDFLTGLGQTSPIIWFGKIPWWGWLSFHDHPPGIFVIQYLFLNIFGQSSFALLLPSALASVLTTYFIYYLVKKVIGQQQALLASFLFAVSSYAVWIVRTGYTEAVLGLFIILAFLFFTFFIKYVKFKYWFYFVLFLSLTIITKYTGIFLIGIAGLYFLFWQRSIFKSKFFWLSNLLFPLILSPVIVYNIMLWRTRGHLDAALSSMVGMRPEDYSILLRGVDPNVFVNIKLIFFNFYQSASLPFFILIMLSIIWLVIQVMQKNRHDVFKRILLLNIVLIILMFGFADTAPRFLVIILPFFCISLALFIWDSYKKLAKYKVIKKLFIILIILVFGFEIFYNINTNLSYRPLGIKGLTYSRFRFPNNGFNELDNYLRAEAYGALGEKRIINILDENILNYDLSGREVILFDDRTHWNSRMWYVHRYQVHYNVPVVFLGDVVRELNNTDSNIFQYLLDAGVTGFWLVVAEDESLIKGDIYYQSADYNIMINNMAQELESSGIAPVKEIYNNYNQLLFKVYHFYLK